MGMRPFGNRRNNAKIRSFSAWIYIQSFLLDWDGEFPNKEVVEPIRR
jgi:hypothetical protein